MNLPHINRGTRWASRRAVLVAAIVITLASLVRGRQDDHDAVPVQKAATARNSELIRSTRLPTTLQLDDHGNWHSERRPRSGGTENAPNQIALLDEDEAEEDEDKVTSGQHGPVGASFPESVAPRPLHARVNRHHDRQNARSSSQRLVEPLEAHQVLAELAEESFLTGTGDDPQAKSKESEGEGGEKKNHEAVGNEGSADEVADAPAGKCLAVGRQDQNGTNRLSFRVDDLSGYILSITETFELHLKPDCMGDPVNASVAVSPVIDVTDVLAKSYISIHISQGFLGQTMYVCQARNGVSSKGKPKCLAEVTWEKARFRPSQLLLWMPDVIFVRSLKEYSYQADRLEDIFLTLIEWIILIGGVVLLLSAAHALHFVLTTETCEGPQELNGLSPLSISIKVRVYTLLMVTFLIGIQSLVALSTKIISPHVQGWVVEAVLMSGLFVGVVGLLWLTRISCIVQINEAALMHGKCVMPLPSKLVLPLFDLVVISVFVFFLGLAGGSFFLVADDMATGEFAGCLSGFLGVVRVFNTVQEQRRSRMQGLCQVSLGKISTAVECIKGRQEDDPNELDLLEHISDNGKVELTMDQVCVACRKGEDPFQQAQAIKKNEDLPGGQDFTYQDLRWHAKYIHSKTGSKASILTVPLACALLLLMLLQFARTAYQCKIVAPRLTRLQSSAGILVPDFSPDTKEYTLLHDRSVSSFSFLTEAVPEVSKRKLFDWTRNSSNLDATEPMMMVNLQGMDSIFPFIMRINMLGGHLDRYGIYSRQEHYRITFAAVSHLFVSMTLKSGDWSRCIYWGAMKDKTIGLPSFRETGKHALVDIEVSTVAYAVRMPLSLEQWQYRVNAGYFGLGTVFEAYQNATEPLCKQACWQYEDCIMSHVSATGCFHAMYARKKGSGCWDAHNHLAIVNAEGSPLQQLDELNSAMGYFCEPGKLNWQACKQNSTISHTGHLRFKGVSLTQGQNEFNFVLGMTWAGASRRVRVQDHSIKLWRGSPLPQSIFLAVPKGISYYTLSSNNLHTLQFNRFDVGRFMAGQPMIQILIVLSVEDDDFEVVYPDGVKPWDGHKEDFDLGLCETGESLFERLWICSEGDESPAPPAREGQTASGIIEVDPFHLATMESVLEVRPKRTSELVGSADAAVARLAFSTVGGISPVQWALEDRCILYGRGTYTEITNSMTHQVLLAGLNSCYEHGVEFYLVRKDPQESDLVFRGNVSYIHFLSMAIRKEKSASKRLQYIHAALEHHATVVEEILQIGFGGLHLNHKLRDKDGLGCFIAQEPWRGVRIDFDDIFLDKRTDAVVDLACTLGKSSQMEQMMISPNTFATMIGMGVDEDQLVRLLDCVGMETEKLDGGFGPLREEVAQWSIEGSSPLVAATRANYGKFVKRVLEIYPETVGCKVELLRDGRRQMRAAGITDHLASKLGVLEFAMVNGCVECVTAAADAIERVATDCQQKMQTEGLLDEEVCNKFLAKMGRIGLGSVGFQWNFTVLKDGLEYLSEKGVIVTVLDLRANGLGNTEMDVLKTAIGSLKHLKVLDLSDNHLTYCNPKDQEGSEQASGLDFLKDLERLEMLELRGAKLCQGGFTMLLKALPLLPNLKGLDLSSTRMGKVDVATIQSFGKALPSILEFNISSNELGSSLLSGLFSPGTPFQSSLTSLSMMDNNLKIEETEFLGKLIAGLPNLVNLRIGHNCLGNAGMESLGAAFSKLPQLKEVDMRDICLTGEGLSSLGRAAGIVSLDKLVLRDNNLGKDTAKVVAAHFAGISSRPPPPADQSLSEVLDWCHRPGLKLLDIRNTSFEAGMDTLVQELGENGRLHDLIDLHMDRSEGRPLEVPRDLGAALRSSYCLESLSLSKLGQQQALTAEHFPFHLLQDLSPIRFLQTFDMSGFLLTEAPSRTDTNAPLTRVDPQEGALPSVHTLYMKNCICPKDTSCFAWMRRSNALEVIDVSGSSLDARAWRDLFTIFMELGSLKEIYLTGMHFNLEDVRDLLEVPEPPSLSYMVGDFSQCDLRDLRQLLSKTVVHSTLA